MRRVLTRNADFRKLWSGLAISQLGDHFTSLALPLTAVLVLDASAAQMGVLTASFWLPYLLLSLGVSVWFDRGRHLRRVLVGADIARAVALLTVPIAYWLDLLTFPHLVAASFAVGAMSVLFSVGYSVFFPRVVERGDIVEANGALSVTRSASYMAGPPVAGAAVQAVGAPVAVLGDALSFVGSALFIARIRTEDRLPAAEGESVRTRLAEGFRFLFGHHVLRAFLACVTTINFFNFGFAALVVLFMSDDLGLSPTAIGAVLGAGAVGSLVGASVGPAVGRRVGMGPAVMLGAVLFTTPLLLFPLAGGSDTVVLAMLFAAEFLSGFGVMVFDIHGNALSLLLTPERLQARRYATFTTVNYGSRPIGALLGGALGALIGVREALLVTVVGGMLGVLWLVASPTRAVRDVPAEAT